jgi:hypothetical protein
LTVVVMWGAHRLSERGLRRSVDLSVCSAVAGL